MLRVALISLVLVSCSAPVFYSDAVLRLAAPEVLQAWDQQSWPLSPPRVDTSSGDAASVLKDLAARSPAPKSILVGFPVTQAMVNQWQGKYPGLRVIRLAPAGLATPETVLVRLNRRASWVALVKAAAKGRKGAAASLPASASVEDSAALREAWHSAGATADLLLLASGAAVPAGTEDVFALDPNNVPSLTALPDARLHTGLGVIASDSPSRAGWELRLDVTATAETLGRALESAAGTVLDLPVVAVSRLVRSRS